jgi:hypothetical protein
VTASVPSLGSFDLIVICPTDIRAISVKGGGARLSAIEREQ